MRATVDACEQKSVLEPFIASGQRRIYEPNHPVVESFDGELSKILATVPGTPWSATQVLYFVGCSPCMYFILPYTFLGCEEVEPWVEAGEK